MVNYTTTNTNMQKRKLAAKIIFFVFLAFLFIYLFGFKSIKKFLEKNTFTETSVLTSDQIKPPAMTVCNLQAWKKIQNEQKRNLRFACGNTSNIYECITEKTFTRDQE